MPPPLESQKGAKCPPLGVRKEPNAPPLGVRKEPNAPPLGESEKEPNAPPPGRVRKGAKCPPPGSQKGAKCPPPGEGQTRSQMPPPVRVSQEQMPPPCEGQPGSKGPKCPPLWGSGRSQMPPPCGSRKGTNSPPLWESGNRAPCPPLLFSPDTPLPKGLPEETLTDYKGEKRQNTHNTNIRWGIRSAKTGCKEGISEPLPHGTGTSKDIPPRDINKSCAQRKASHHGGQPSMAPQALLRAPAPPLGVGGSPPWSPTLRTLPEVLHARSGKQIGHRTTHPTHDPRTKKKTQKTSSPVRI